MMNTPVNFRVQSSNGKIWDIPENNLDEAMRRRGEIVHKVQSSDGRIWEIPESKVKQALDRGGKLYQENPNENTPPQQQSPELSFTDRLLQYGRGVAEIPASVVDAGTHLASKSSIPGVATDVMGALPIEPEQNLKGTNLTEKVHEKFNEFAGKDITPTDTLGRVLNTGGNFSFPFPGSGVLKGAKAGVESVKQIGANLAKNASVGLGGAAAVEGTKDYRLTNEGTATGHVEDFLKAVFGMSLADKGLSAAKKSILEKSSKDLEEFMGHSSKAIKEESTEALEGIGLKEKAIGKVLSLGAKPNKRITELAKEYDIQLPFQVALGGKIHKVVSNNVLKSMFTADVYKNVIQEADEAMINSVKDKLNNISSEIVSGQVASSRAKNFLEGEKKSIEDQVKQMYERDFSYLKSTDTVNPKPIADTVKSMLKIPALSAPVPGPQSRPVANYLKDIGEKLGFIPPKNVLKEYENNPDFIKIVIDAYTENPKNIPVRDLVGQLHATREFINYEKDTGVKKLLQGVASSISKAIESTENKEFLTSYQNTNQFFKQEVVDRIRTDMSRSLMTGEIPKEAFEYMGGAPEIRKLGQIIGDSKNGKEIFASLKRAKLEQIIADKIIDASGAISYAKLSNMFLRNPENQAVLKELLGDQYKNLTELAEISQAFVKAEKEFGNPSGTSYALRDIQGMGDIIKLTLNTIGTVSLSAAGALTQGVLGGLEAPVAINVISRLVSNKKYVETALKYAEAAKKKNAQSTKVLENRLTRIAKGILEEVGTHPQASLELISSTKNENNGKRNGF